MNLDDVNDRLGTSFASEDYDSLGGLIIEHLDRLPEVNDEVITEDGIRLKVDKLDKNRVESVHVFFPEKTDDDEETSGTDGISISGSAQEDGNPTDISENASATSD